MDYTTESVLELLKKYEEELENLFEKRGHLSENDRDYIFISGKIDVLIDVTTNLDIIV